MGIGIDRLCQRGCQCCKSICLGILKAWHMAYVEAIERVGQCEGRLVIWYQVFVSNLVFSSDLINNQLGVAVGFEVLDLKLFSNLEPDEEGIILSYIIGTWFC